MRERSVGRERVGEGRGRAWRTVGRESEVVVVALGNLDDAATLKLGDDGGKRFLGPLVVAQEHDRGAEIRGCGY